LYENISHPFFLIRVAPASAFLANSLIAFLSVITKESRTAEREQVEDDTIIRLLQSKL